MKEYQFKVGNVWLDVHAESKAEAVRIVNEELPKLDEPLPAPGRLQRVQLNIRNQLTAKDIVSVYDMAKERGLTSAANAL
jgi:hypothetical protein